MMRVRILTRIRMRKSVRLMWMRRMMMKSRIGTRLMVRPRLSQSAGASPMWSIILDLSRDGANSDVNYRRIGQVTLITAIRN